MAAYVIVDVEVTDPERFKQYQALAPGAVEQYGGRYLARGGDTAVLEGDLQAHRVVVLEFPSVDDAKTFYNSPEYQRAIEARRGAATFHFMIAVAGV